MKRDVVTVGPLMTLREAGTVLSEHRITGAPVVDRWGELMGVVSQTDIVRCGATQDELGAPCFYGDPDAASVFETASNRSELDTMRVLDVMTKDLIRADEDAPVEDVIALMLERGVHRVVITRGSKLRGIITTMDVLGSLRAAPAR